MSLCKSALSNSLAFAPPLWVFSSVIRFAAWVISVTLVTVSLWFVSPGPLFAAVESQPYPPAGVMPQHLPPLLIGRLEAVSSKNPTLRMLVTGNRNLGTTSVNVILPGYSNLDRLIVMNSGAFQRGDSIMIQGNAGLNNSFGARRIIRLAKRAPLAPGLSLATGAPAAGGGMQATPMMMKGADASPAAAAPSPIAADTSPTSPPVTLHQTGATVSATMPSAVAAGSKPLPSGRDLQRARLEALAAKLVLRSARRGVLTGQIVSSAPLIMEAYDGSLWNVTLAAGGIALNQIHIPITDLRGGDSLLIKGSETGSGNFRASEVDVLPTGVPLIEAQGRSKARGGRGRQ